MQHLSSSPLELTRAFAKASSQGLMDSAQYFRVVIEILARGSCDLLIFGAGVDTPLYRSANANGKTLVIEDQSQWAVEADRVSHCDLLQVRYTTRLGDGWSKDCPLPNGLTEEILRLGWDVILVDGPEGYRDDKPGRQQSIFAASVASKPGSTVFVHDFEREMEQRAAAHYLGKPSELIGERSKLAVFHSSENVLE